MRHARVSHSFLIATVMIALSASRVPAQQRESGGTAVVATAPIPAATMQNFAAAHAAIAEYRGKVQAELAEPRSKKPESQEMLRAKLQEGTDRLIKEHHLTQADYTALTRRVSTDDAVRKQFEDALAQLSKR